MGDKCFWAGEKAGGYILHHNLKDAGGGGGDEPIDEDRVVASSQNQARGDVAANATAKPAADKANVAHEPAQAAVHQATTAHADAGAPDAHHQTQAPVEVTLVGHHDLPMHHFMSM